MKLRLVWRQLLTLVLDYWLRQLLALPRHVTFLLRPVLSWILIAYLARTAAAINIVIQKQNDGENPSYDVDGSRLAAIFNAAAAYWEDYLPEAGETGTYEVDVIWSLSEFEDDPALARWSFENGGDNNIFVNPKPMSGDDLKQWYFDNSPFNNSEYDFVTQNRNFDDNRWDYLGGQWLYRDVDPVEKNSWFTGNPPDVMEIGYRGRATDPALFDQYDLLTAALHELGHELGVNETGGPWDASSVWLRSGSAGFTEAPESGHLQARTSLMCEGCGLLGTRRLPSAMDIMAVADDEKMGLFDLPRRDYVGSGEWSHPVLGFNTDYGWMGGLPPEADNDAFLRDGNVVHLNVNAQARNLLVDESSDLKTGAFTLTVGQQTTIGGGFDGGTIRIEAGGKLTTADAWVAGALLTSPGAMIEVDSRLYIPSGGNLNLSNAIAEVGQVFIQDPLDPLLTGGLLSGRGTVDASGILVNDGKISATGGTLLFLSTTNSALWNLDGSTGTGLLEAISGDLTFLGPHLTFDSNVTVGSGRTFTVNDMWKLGETGRLNLIGDVNAPATIHGFAGSGHATIAGRVFVDILGVFDIAVTFEPTAIVQVPDNNDFLRLLASTTYKGGSFPGNGVIEQVGSASVEGDTTIDVRVYDWDGSETGPSTTSIDPEVVFTINSHDIELTPNDGHDGTINVNGGILEVNSKVRIPNGFEPGPWQLDRLGRLNLKNGGLVPDIPTDGPGAIVRGAPLIVEGSVRAIGKDNRIESDTTFLAAASVELADRFSDLSLAGATTFLGGSYTGAGVLHQKGHAAIEGNTENNVAAYNWDGLETAPSNTIVAPGVQFTLNVGALETSASDGHDGVITLRNGSRLNVNTPAAWRVDGVMRLDNATVNGSPLVNFGKISGDGAINTDVTNHGTIAPGLSPGVLRINADYHQQTAGLLHAELAGAAFGEFDLLRVLDDASLNGTLQVTLLNGFEPVLGSTFTILTTEFGSIAGSFAAEVLPYFSGRSFDVIFNPKSVVLQVVEATAIPGDYNQNGAVDAADYVVWRDTQGQMGTGLAADGNGNNQIDTGDYDVWRAHFGNTFGTGSSLVHIVPEPAAGSLLIVACLAVLAVRRRCTYDNSSPWPAGAIAIYVGFMAITAAARGDQFVMEDYPVPAGSRPHDVAPAPDGRVWYTAQNAGALGWLKPDTGQTHHIPLGAGSRPHGVIVGPDGAPWITDGGRNAIIRVDPVTEQVTPYPLPANRPNANLNTATFDNSGVLWFTGQNGVYGRLNPMTGIMDVYSAPRGPGPYGITTTPSGDVYYASLAGDYVGKIDLTTGAATVLTPPTVNQGARRVWSDSLGQIWVSEWDAGQVARYNPATGQWREWPLPGANPSAYAVYVDEQDIVWLSDFGGNSLVRFDPVSEEFDPFPLPSSPSNVRQILGRPGEVWGAESAADQLVVIRIVPDELPGDYNQDGTVDAADYVVWRNTLDQSGTGLAADGNGNHQIDAGDYDVWRANFGNTAKLGGGAFAVLPGHVSVPEPHSLYLLSLAGLIVISRRIRSGQ